MIWSYIDLCDLNHIEKLLHKKKSVIKIKNMDELCCARALVTMKAYRDLGFLHHSYKDLRKGRPIQEQQAKELHASAQVPEGLCGLTEIQQFQNYLKEYQIVVVSVDHGYQIICKGPDQPKEKLLVLIKIGDHFHACTLLKGFLSKAHFCLACEKSFQHNDWKNHACKGKRCQACHQLDCPDFAAAETGPKATVACNHCHRLFFRKVCFAMHKERQDKSRGQNEKQCLSHLQEMQRLR